MKRPRSTTVELRRCQRAEQHAGHYWWPQPGVLCSCPGFTEEEKAEAGEVADRCPSCGSLSPGALGATGWPYERDAPCSDSWHGDAAWPVPERAGREGDTQPLPVASDTPIMHHLVQQDLEARLQVGIKRYGQPLQAFNGRNALRDAYEEVLDLAVYLRQEVYERDVHHADAQDSEAIEDLFGRYIRHVFAEEGSTFLGVELDIDFKQLPRAQFSVEFTPDEWKFMERLARGDE